MQCRLCECDAVFSGFFQHHVGFLQSRQNKIPIRIAIVDLVKVIVVCHYKKLLLQDIMLRWGNVGVIRLNTFRSLLWTNKADECVNNQLNGCNRSIVI